MTEEIPLSKLKEKMFLANDIISDIKKPKDNEDIKTKKSTIENFTLSKSINITFFSYLKKNNFNYINYNPNLGLTSKNLDWFKTNKSKINFDSIRIYDTMHFAPFIFGGVLLTLIAKGNIFVFIMKLFS